MSEEKKYPAIQPHSGLQKVSDTIYWVSGCFKPGPPGVRIGVTMTIVKRGEDLTIFNTTRVSKAVEDEIAKLGTIKNVVRLSGHHGMADEYYIDTFKATYWDLPGISEGVKPKPTKTPHTDNLLSDGEGGCGPIPEATVHLVKNLKTPDAVVLLPDDGGTLICADFIQNGIPTPENSFGGKLIKGIFGFNTGCCNTPKMFFKAYGKETPEDIYEPNVPVVLGMKFDTIIR